MVSPRYEFKELLGSGSFGEVYRGIDKLSNRNVAIKLVKSNRVSKKYSNFSEVQIMDILLDRNSRYKKHIVQLYDCFEVDGYEVLILELLFCNLYQGMDIEFYQGYSLEKIASIGLQLCMALCHLQDINIRGLGKTSIIHGDLKLDNIMFTDDTWTTIKIIDFGMSYFEVERFTESIQNRNYRAPEDFFLFEADITPAADMWSVGVILFSLFAKKDLFRSKTDEEQMANLVNIFGEPTLEMIGGDPSLGLLFNMCGDKPKLRCKIRSKATIWHSFAYLFTIASDSMFMEPKSIPWLEKFNDLLLKMFEMNPKLRLKPQEAIEHPFFELVKKKSMFQTLRDKFIRKFM